MKGVILAGGTGSRLFPLTKITNKHLLPVYDRPMIYYPIQAMVKAGIKDIMVVTGGNHAGEFLRLLGSGHEFGLKHLAYAYQERPGGIGEALGLAEHFCDGDKVCVMLGDNILQYSIEPGVRAFEQQGVGSRILLTEVKDPEQYGVAEIQGSKVVRIEEKPKSPKSNLAVIGVYFYDEKVFEFVRGLTPSGRGELEITDVNNGYIRQGAMTYETIPGWWGDAGATIDSLWEVSHLVAQTGANLDSPM